MNNPSTVVIEPYMTIQTMPSNGNSASSSEMTSIMVFSETVRQAEVTPTD